MIDFASKAESVVNAAPIVLI